ncbi:MAG: hypothetical protein HRU23_06325 [Gammaproteobacteria bacterium]|nr:hypothetical protein [Gammaproteobacteria bacterium]
MSKLDKLKEWFTLEDAAKHISKKIDETITIDDLYRSALDGYLKLSVYFVNNAYGITGKLCDIDNQLPQDFDTKRSDVQNIEGIWDLSMRGLEAHLIEEHFVQGSSGLRLTQQSKYEHGILLQRDGVICRLYKGFDRKTICDPKFNESEERQRAIAEAPMRALENHLRINHPLLRTGRFGIEYAPCAKFSDLGCVLIIKSLEVTRFIQSLEDTPQEEKPLHDKERTTLLTLIGALLKEQNINYSEKGAGNPATVKLIVEKSDMTISENTVRKIFRQISETLG